ncbi:MAG: hypothetical protein OEZ22_06495 [Spirochaetia bacterium]|nr:hypothetical protein [Spirochaetia bacterium]
MHNVSRKNLFKNLILKTADLAQKPADKLNTFIDGYAEEKIKKKIYIAKIETDECLTYRGIVCMSCLDACPQNINGLLIEHGCLVINKEICNGCGDCINKCSISPSAIKLEERPVYVK